MKRFLGVLLAVCMLTSLLPAATVAAEGEQRLTLPLEADTEVMTRINANDEQNAADRAKVRGDAADMTITRAGNRKQAVMRFDTSGLNQLPDGAVISGVYLTLTIKTAPTNVENGGVWAKYAFSRFLKKADPWDDWTEGAAASPDGALNGDLVNARANVTSGGYQAEKQVEFSYESVGETGQMTVDVKPILDAERTSNGGTYSNKTSIWFRCADDKVNGSSSNVTDMKLYSKEGDAAKAPKLEVVYTTASGGAAAVQQDLDALTLKEGDADLDLAHISRNLVLPRAGTVNGSPISWETSDASVVTAAGVVTRPAGAEDTKTATLTATVGEGEFALTKTFSLTVTNIKYPEADVFWTDKNTENPDGKRADFQVRGTKSNSAIYRAGFLRFDLPEIPQGHSVATATLTLEKKSGNAAHTHYAAILRAADRDWPEYTATYQQMKDASQNKDATGAASYQTKATGRETIAVDVTNQVKTAVLAGQTDKIGIMIYETASADDNNAAYETRESTASPVLTITTQQSGGGEQEIVDADQVLLALGDTGKVVGDLDLPVAGANGCEITWSSANTAVAADGTVTRPAIGQPNASGKLTATLKKGSATATKSFDVTVLSNSYPEADATVQGGSKSGNNFGGVDNVAVRYDHYREGYVRFDTRGIDDVITSAKVRFTFTSSKPSEYSVIKLAAVEDTGWTEGGLKDAATGEGQEAYLTYATKPDYGYIVAEGNPAGGNAIEFDITDYAAMKAAANEKMSFMLYSTQANTAGNLTEGPTYNFASKENSDVAKMPIIEITTAKNDDLKALYADLAQVDVPRNAEQNLTLPAVGANGTAMDWRSENGMIMADGTLIRPALGQPDAPEVLTVTASKGGAEKTFSFPLTVLAQYVAATGGTVAQGDTAYGSAIPATAAPTFSAMVKNGTDKTIAVRYFAAYYDGDALAGVQSGSIADLAAGASREISHEMGTMTNRAGQTVKFYVWYDFHPAMQPMSRTIEG